MQWLVLDKKALHNNRKIEGLDVLTYLYFTLRQNTKLKSALSKK